MANEATLIFETDTPIPFTCADGTGIEKGALLKMTDPMTAIAPSATNEAVAGIASVEKIASDGCTKVSVYRNGIFKVTLSGSCSVGDALILEGGTIGSNLVMRSQTMSSVSGANIIGTALETGTTGESILMELHVNRVRYN